MKISIIIPVYNVEDYLDKCLESVINQSLTDIEIICINDGSTDNSLEILNRCAKKDDRILVVNKKNEGVSSARNTGLKLAQGEYIMFVDSDDELCINACKTAYDKISSTNSDIGVFGHYECGENIKIESPKNKQLQKFENDDTLKDYTKFQTLSWDKIYKKSFLTEYQLEFPQGIKTSEDSIFCWSCYFKNPKYCIINKPLYIYNIQREGSATSNWQMCIKNDLEAIKTFHKLPEFIKQPTEIKLKIISKFCKGAIYYWDKYYNLNARKLLIKDVRQLVNFIDKNYSSNELKNIKYYKKLKSIYTYTILNEIFSIKNIGFNKIVTIFGIKIKINKKK